MPSSPASTIKAVARLAEVSTSTVSRALRGHPLLAESTVARVRAAADRVGYRVNPVISDLMRRVRGRGRLNHLGSIAYLTFHPTRFEWRKNPTYQAFYEGAARRARELGFSLEAIWAREPGLSRSRLTGILKARAVGGVIVGPRPSPVAPDILEWSHFSAASLGIPLPELQLHQAGSHHARSLSRALAALKQRKYQRPGLVLFNYQLPEIERGWPTTWAYHQLQQPSASRIPLLALDGFHKKEFLRWYRRHRPDVLIGLQELMDWMPRLGLLIPRDVAFAHLSRPNRPDAPAGVDQMPAEIGASAVDLVVNQILADERGAPVHPRLSLIVGEWVDGWTARSMQSLH